MSLDSGYDLTNLASDLNLRAEKFSGFLNLLTGDDLTNLELQLLKIIESDLWLCLDIDHILCFLLFYLFLRLFFRLFFLRMKLLNLLKNLFQVKSRKKDLRFVGYAVS